MTSFAAEKRPVPVPTPVVVTPANPGWMSNSWRVIKASINGMETPVNGVESHDTLRLRADGTIQLQKNHGQTTLWGTSCMLTSAGLSGVTADVNHTPFLIQFNSANHQVTCTFFQTLALARGTDPKVCGPGGTGGVVCGPGGTGATWVAEEGGAPEPEPPSGSGPSHG
jgi:hypothetical protein